MQTDTDNFRPNSDGTTPGQGDSGRAKIVFSEGSVSEDTEREEKLFAADQSRSGTTWASSDLGQGVSIHTGFPNPGIDARLHGLDFNQLLVQNSTSTFLMRVSGSDWQHLGIFHGDIAVIDRALSPKPNDLIIWHHSGDFAISELNRMRPGASMWGIVTAIIHQFRKTEEDIA